MTFRGKKRILLTGASGMIAGAFINAYSGHYEIMALSRKSLILSEGIEVVRYNLNDFTLAAGEIISFKPDIVINTAFYLSSKRDEDAIKQFADSLRLANLICESLCHLESLHWIETRSFSEFVFSKNGSFTPQPCYLYSMYKSLSFELIQWYGMKNTNFLVSELILFTVYGKKSMSKKIIDYLIEAADAKDTMILSSGKQVLDFVHISDVLSAVEHVIYSRNKRIWVGSGKGVSLIELSKHIEKYTGPLNVEWSPKRDRPDDIYYAVAPTYLNDGWKSLIPFEEGIKDYVSSYAL